MHRVTMKRPRLVTEMIDDFGVFLKKHSGGEIGVYTIVWKKWSNSNIEVEELQTDEREDLDKNLGVAGPGHLTQVDPTPRFQKSESSGPI